MHHSGFLGSICRTLHQRVHEDEEKENSPVCSAWRENGVPSRGDMRHRGMRNGRVVDAHLVRGIRKASLVASIPDT